MRKSKAGNEAKHDAAIETAASSRRWSTLATIAACALSLNALSWVALSAESFAAPGDVVTAPTPIQASYSIPFERGLEPVLRYPLDNATFQKRDGGKIFLDYVLPEDLIGRRGERMVMFTSQPIKETDTFIHFLCQRTDSEASCTRANGRLVCAVQFRGLDIQPAQVKGLLLEKYGAGDPLMASRLLAAEKFAADAVGVIQIELPSR